MKNKLLYEYALKLAELKPWKYLNEEDLIKITIDDIPYYCCILGFYNECYAINIYKGYEARLGLSDIASCPDSFPQEQMIRYHNSINCFFDDINLLEEEDVLELSKVDYPHGDIYPYFRTYKPKYFANLINLEDRETLLLIFPYLVELLTTKLTKDNKQMHLPGMIYSYNPVMNDFSIISDNIPPLKIVNTYDMFQEEIDMLMNAPTTNNIIEVDSAYLNVPIPIDEDNFANACLSVCIDHNTYHAYSCNMLEPKYNYNNVLLDDIISYIDDNGIPKIIYVRDRYIHSYVSIIKEYIDVEIVIKPDLNAIDEFIDNFLELSNPCSDIIN